MLVSVFENLFKPITRAEKYSRKKQCRQRLKEAAAQYLKALKKGRIADVNKAHDVFSQRLSDVHQCGAFNYYEIEKIDYAFQERKNEEDRWSLHLAEWIVKNI